MSRRLELRALDGRFAVCRLEPGSKPPGWALSAGFCSITRTADELSVVCPEADVPEGVWVERGWRAFRVAGAMEFAVVGVLASLTGPLADAGIALFAVSTFDTDYILIKEENWARAVAILRASGHAFFDSAPGIGPPGPLGDGP